MKKLLSLLMTIAMTLTLCTSCMAAETGSEDFILTMQIDNPIMTVNGAQQEIDEGRGTTPVIVNDRTLVPIRAIIEAMGGTVSWEQEAQTATLNYNNDKIDLVIGQTTAYLNGAANTLDVAPAVINERTMLPIRFIAESFKFDVDWNNATQTVTVSKKAQQQTETPNPVPGENNGGSKVLVAYFTVPETDDVDAVAQASRVVDEGEVVGNVEFIAKTIQEELNADIFTIETVQQYPGTHQELLEFAAAEMGRNDRPELKTKLDNLDEYDTIFFGFPIWNADLPMPVYTFLDEYDLSGKTIIPFTAHGGSGFAGTISTLVSEEPNAKVERDGFSVSRNSVSGAKSDIISWVKGFGLTAAADTNTASGSNILVAYFSHTGNTKEVAEYIQKQTNADIFEIKAKEAYTGGTQAVSDRAKDEEEKNARPELVSLPDNIEQYDTIFIGYPIWYYNAPMVIGTFLESCNLSGKTIIPFCTSSSSDIDVSMDLIKETSKNATVKDGLTANGGNSEIDEWLNNLNIK